eukprot:GEMP01005525.1.p1 GENE.GEMP01005525.1~~GEMP01005525.1.p1  ORF type:complete len:724 (+),score=151.12 GEMP01005525.1:426-2597(+)
MSEPFDANAWPIDEKNTFVHFGTPRATTMKMFFGKRHSLPANMSSTPADEQNFAVVGDETSVADAARLYVPSSPRTYYDGSEAPMNGIGDDAVPSDTPNLGGFVTGSRTPKSVRFSSQVVNFRGVCFTRPQRNNEGDPNPDSDSNSDSDFAYVAGTNPNPDDDFNPLVVMTRGASADHRSAGDMDDEATQGASSVRVRVPHKCLTINTEDLKPAVKLPAHFFPPTPCSEYEAPFYPDTPAPEHSGASPRLEHPEHLSEWWPRSGSAGPRTPSTLRTLESFHHASWRYARPSHVLSERQHWSDVLPCEQYYNGSAPASVGLTAPTESRHADMRNVAEECRRNWAEMTLDGDNEEDPYACAMRGLLSPTRPDDNPHDYENRQHYEGHNYGDHNPHYGGHNYDGAFFHGFNFDNYHAHHYVDRHFDEHHSEALNYSGLNVENSAYESHNAEIHTPYVPKSRRADRPVKAGKKEKNATPEHAATTTEPDAKRCAKTQRSLQKESSKHDQEDQKPAQTEGAPKELLRNSQDAPAEETLDNNASADPRLATWSLGSELHERRECKPCLFYHTVRGCHEGAECAFCHYCPIGEVQQRRKEKTTELRLQEKRYRRQEERKYRKQLKRLAKERVGHHKPDERNDLELSDASTKESTDNTGLQVQLTLNTLSSEFPAPSFNAASSPRGSREIDKGSKSAGKGFHGKADHKKAPKGKGKNGKSGNKQEHGIAAV